MNMEPTTAISALTSGLGDLSGDLVDAVISVAPYALAVVAAVLIWKFGIKFFKGLTGR
jgi:hypothetical protein